MGVRTHLSEPGICRLGIFVVPLSMHKPDSIEGIIAGVQPFRAGLQPGFRIQRRNECQPLENRSGSFPIPPFQATTHFLV